MGKKMRKKWFELIIYLVLFLLIGTGTELHSSALEAASVTDATESDADVSYGSYDVKQSIVVLQAVYIGEDGYPNILGQENGFFIGTADSGFFFICGRACITFLRNKKWESQRIWVSTTISFQSLIRLLWSLMFALG